MGTRLAGRIAGPLSRIRPVNIKLLTLAELEFVVANHEHGHHELAWRLGAQGDLLTSGLDRASVV